MDKSTWGGIVIAVGGIVAGLLLEGGRIAQILQPTAAMIVFGGTFGAVMIQYPLSTIGEALKHLVQVFVEKKSGARSMVDDLLRYAHQARVKGLVSLDEELPKIRDPFLKRTLMMAVDGITPGELRHIMELELENQVHRQAHIPKVFEAAAGFAPTVGIIGAVLGLIQVMQHLENINEVGRGIAVAFVATVYGVGSANVLFLPWAGKLKIRLQEQQLLREMTLEGVVCIQEGMNPRAIESRLLSFGVTPAAGGSARGAQLSQSEAKA